MTKYNKAMQSVGIGGGGGAVLIWIWGAVMPEYPMPAEVGAILAGAIAAIANAFMPANT